MLSSQAQHPYDAESHSKFTTPVVAVAITLFLLWFLNTGVSQTVTAALLIGVGGVLVFLRPTAAIVATLVYLLFMGDIRRYVSMHTGLISQDPLLLVGPAIISLLFTRLVFERRITVDTPLARLVVALMILMGLEVFNPLQGGLTVGIAGGLFYIVPLLWFWAGRSLPTERLTGTLLKGVFPLLALAAALLGLWQTFVGPLAFEAQWIREQIANGFNSMVIDGAVIRNFSYFTSPAEYAGFLGLGLTCCIAPVLVWRFRASSLLIPVLVWAMFLASIRSAIVLVGLAVMSMWSMIGRDARQVVARAFLAVVVGGGGMYFGLHRLQGALGGDSKLLDHTLEGLVNPGESSAEGHWSLTLIGVATGLKNPIGEGLGATTMAASKFSTHGGGFENDVANMFASLGVFGGLLYVGTILYVLYHTCTVWRQRRSMVALMTLGVLLSQIGYWLEGGHYALVAICWFLIGSIDRVRPVAERQVAADEGLAWAAEPHAGVAAAARRQPRRAPIGAAQAPSWRPPAASAGVGDAQ
ncbi:MAG TPA: hypothetical protein VGI81_09065 [Tepidisphaeraceae bacterium]|jgi:hypothetical protein